MNKKQIFISTILSLCPTLLFFWTGMTINAGWGFSLFIALAAFSICFGICCLIILIFRTDPPIKSNNNLFYYISGLGADVQDNDCIRLKLNNDALEINKVKLKMFSADEIIQTWKINAADILKADIITKEELKNKSILGRSAVGALLLGPVIGPVGAVLGGLTALKNSKIKTLFAISYLPSQGNKPQTIIFDAEAANSIGYNKKYISNLKKQLANIPKSQHAKDYLGIFDTVQNEDGSIQL
ncbi:MAG: hypothetical protein HFI72_06990 [Peptococcaceae bacterium]|jgi:hypothetical protein|nr:hypothetical protein [Peptococcaceae bacterium]